MYRNENLDPADFLLDLLIQSLQDHTRLHSHKCDECHAVWHHTGANAGNEQAHMCPNCNAGPFWTRY